MNPPIFYSVSGSTLVTAELLCEERVAFRYSPKDKTIRFALRDVQRASNVISILKQHGLRVVRKYTSQNEDNY